jgi:hypothetical protein
MLRVPCEHRTRSVRRTPGFAGIGAEDGPSGDVLPRQTRRRFANPSEKALNGLPIDLDDSVRNVAVGREMHGLHGGWIGCLYQAKAARCPFMVPIRDEANSVSPLVFEIADVRGCERLRRDAFEIMLVHVERHRKT